MSDTFIGKFVRRFSDSLLASGPITAGIAVTLMSTGVLGIIPSAIISSGGAILGLSLLSRKFHPLLALDKKSDEMLSRTSKKSEALKALNKKIKNEYPGLYEQKSMIAKPEIDQGNLLIASCETMIRYRSCLEKRKFARSLLWAGSLMSVAMLALSPFTGGTSVVAAPIILKLILFLPALLMNISGLLIYTWGHARRPVCHEHNDLMLPTRRQQCWEGLKGFTKGFKMVAAIHAVAALVILLPFTIAHIINTTVDVAVSMPFMKIISPMAPVAAHLVDIMASTPLKVILDISTNGLAVVSGQVSLFIAEVSRIAANAIVFVAAGLTLNAMTAVFQTKRFERWNTRRKAIKQNKEKIEYRTQQSQNNTGVSLEVNLERKNKLQKNQNEELNLARHALRVRSQNQAELMRERSIFPQIVSKTDLKRSESMPELSLTSGPKQ